MTTILISNDDGIEARGLQALARAFEDLGRVVVVAPHRERSTTSHSLTLHKPLRVKEVAPDRFAVSGSPADCIYLGVSSILGTKPDLILSGINSGANLGTDIHYSGTVAAARGGALIGVRSYAFSLVSSTEAVPGEPQSSFDYDMAARYALQVVQATRSIEFPPHAFLNVNVPGIPEDRIRGIRVARQGFRHYSDQVDRKVDPRGKPYYWIAGGYVGFDESAESDCRSVHDGYISVTPLTIDSTDDGFLGVLREIGF